MHDGCRCAGAAFDGVGGSASAVWMQLSSGGPFASSDDWKGGGRHRLTGRLWLLDVLPAFGPTEGEVPLIAARSLKPLRAWALVAPGGWSSAHWQSYSQRAWCKGDVHVVEGGNARGTKTMIAREKDKNYYFPTYYLLSLHLWDSAAAAVVATR